MGVVECVMDVGVPILPMWATTYVVGADPAQGDGDTERTLIGSRFDALPGTRRYISISSGIVSPERSSHKRIVSAESFWDVIKRI